MFSLLSLIFWHFILFPEVSCWWGGSIPEGNPGWSVLRVCGPDCPVAFNVPHPWAPCAKVIVGKLPVFAVFLHCPSVLSSDCRWLFGDFAFPGSDALLLASAFSLCPATDIMKAAGLPACVPYLLVFRLRGGDSGPAIACAHFSWVLELLSCCSVWLMLTLGEVKKICCCHLCLLFFNIQSFQVNIELAFRVCL